jgi:uracil-DNA glycosylase
MNPLFKDVDYGWEELKPLICSSHFDLTVEEIKSRGGKIYPKKEDIFKAFTLCPLSKVRVVILGQDPYHNGQATGLAFGVAHKPIPPSLRIIHKELCNQFDHHQPIEEFDYTLEHWAKQGVLLLNTSLTVKEKNAASHAGLWDWFVLEVIKLIQRERRETIFVLWGKHAQKFKKYINIAVLQSSHPAAEAYSGGQGGFYDNGHFYNINERVGKIDWFKLPEPVTEEEQIKIYDNV